jgi:hypothetical protein
MWDLIPECTSFPDPEVGFVEIPEQVINNGHTYYR